MKIGGKGTLTVAKTLALADGTTITGTGVATSIVRTKPGITQDFPLLVGAGRVKLSDMSFLGDPSMEAEHDFCDFIDAKPTLRDCFFGDRRRDLLVTSRCDGVLVDACEFANWGGALPDNPGAGQWAGGMAVFCLSGNDGRLTNGYAHDGAGGIWIPVTNTLVSPEPTGTGWIVSGWILRRLLECGIVGGDHALITGNSIDDVSRVDVSGHGMELHGTHLTVLGNTITKCDGACIYAANVYNSDISHNTMSGAGRKGDTGTLVLSTFGPEAGEGSDPPHDVTICDNQIDDGYILLANLSSDPSKLMTNIRIRSTCPVLFWPTKDQVVGDGFDCEAPTVATHPSLMAAPQGSTVPSGLARLTQHYRRDE